MNWVRTLGLVAAPLRSAYTKNDVVGSANVKPLATSRSPSGSPESEMMSNSLQRDIDFTKALEDTEGECGVRLDALVAETLIFYAARLYRQDYREARDYALVNNLPDGTSDQERSAYKQLIDRYFNRRSVSARKKRKAEGGNRPFAPTEVYEGDAR
jgi:hypothetical protein